MNGPGIDIVETVAISSQTTELLFDGNFISAITLRANELNDYDKLRNVSDNVNFPLSAVSTFLFGL